MSAHPAPPLAANLKSEDAPGGNVYVGPSLASSLFKFAAALAAAQR